ncbi:hypothetical protein EC973_006671, partial [Apophysomyces ossiformis]
MNEDMSMASPTMHSTTTGFTVPKIRIPELPTYSGERVTSTINTWINIFERYHRTCGWTETYLVHTATLHLRGVVYTWLMNLEQELGPHSLTWNHLKTSLLDYFRPTLS